MVGENGEITEIREGIQISGLQVFIYEVMEHLESFWHRRF